MYILAGESRIDGATIYGETRFYKGLPRPAMRVKVEEGLTATQMQDMLANDWHLMNGEGEDAIEEGFQTGYCELETHEAIFIKMDALEVENNELKEEVQAVSSAIPSLLKGRDDDIIVEMVKYIPEWVAGEYTVGDVRKDASGYPKICVQEHNSITNPEHDITVASLWAPYHAKSKEYALPWIAPTGAHDMYKAGEYMIFTDDKTYECLSDTNFSPVDLPTAWHDVAAGPTPDPEPEEPVDPEEPEAKNSNGTDIWSQWVVWDSNPATLYNVGDLVTHNGIRYTSTQPDNHWEPGVYGWEQTAD